MRRRTAVPLLLLMAIGCTSPGFVRGVKEYAPLIAGEYRTYATRDTAIETSTKAQRIAAADALAAAAKDPVTLQAVEAAWPIGLRQGYGDYIDRDERLDPNERGLRAENMARLDGLIEAESGRWIYGRR